MLMKPLFSISLPIGMKMEALGSNLRPRCDSNAASQVFTDLLADREAHPVAMGVGLLAFRVADATKRIEDVVDLLLCHADALIIHGHQTEATYRLDFLWKLQATGERPGPEQTFQSTDNLQTFQR